MNRELLTKPFARKLIKERAGPHGKRVRYVDIHTVIQRLNEGSDDWSFEIVNHEILETEVIVLGRLTLGGVTKCAFGGSLIEGSTVGDSLKAAGADALKKSASMFGVGLELYHSKVAPEQTRSPAAAHPEADPKDRATVRQMSALQSAARRRGLTQDRLSAMVRARTGKTELALLDRHEASNLISELSGTNGTSH